MKRLMLVYNPRSSQQARIEREVLTEVRQLRSWMVGKYAVKPAKLEENAAQLAKVLMDGDLVVVAGGDGTAAMALNAIMLAEKQAILGVLGYGNFNDIARMTGVRRTEGVRGIVEAYEAGRMRKLYPLEVLVDDKHWRFAPCYATVGLLAEATELMDDEKMRTALNTGKHGPLFSLFQAVGWYFKHKRKQFLPAGMMVNGIEVARGTTDYLAVNGPSLARLMKGGEWCFAPGKFASATKRLGSFWRMVGFGLRSVIFGVKVVETEGDIIEFAEPSNVEIQAEGEYVKLEGVRRIEVRKKGEVKIIS